MLLRTATPAALSALIIAAACGGGGPYVDEDEEPPANRVFAAEGPIDPTTGARAFLGYADPDVPNLAPEYVLSIGGRLILPDPDNFAQSQTKWVPDADSGDSLYPDVGPYGGDCPADGTVTGPQLMDPDRLYPSAYCLREGPDLLPAR